MEDLKLTQSKLDVKMQYLLGFNEPWDTNPNLFDKKHIKPEDAAKWYGEYYIPAAKEMGLKLITPSTIKANVKIDWIVTFFKTCWELRNDTNACDVNAIEVFAMHHYTCHYDDYINAYSLDSKRNSFYQYVVDALTDSSWDGHDQFDWETYIRGMPIWFTETSCEYDGPSSEYAKVSNVDECKRITGKLGPHGRWKSGSIDAIR